MRICQCSSNLAFVNRKKYLGQWLPRSVRVHQSVLLRKDGGQKGRQEAPFTLGSLHQDLCSKHRSITNGFPDEVEKKEWCWHSRCSEKKMEKPEHQSREIMKIMIPATLTQRLFFCFYAFPSLPAPPPILWLLVLKCSFYGERGKSPLELKAIHKIILSKGPQFSDEEMVPHVKQYQAPRKYDRSRISYTFSWF